MVRAFALSLCLLPGHVDACRLALVLAIDVSSSVDAEEDTLQRKGLASALLAPEVQAAFFASPDPVKLFVFEWSGQYHHAVIAEWAVIQTSADLLRAASLVADSERSQRDFPTAMGNALGYAATRLRDVPDCKYRTVDVSGDGINNDGFSPQQAYSAFPFDDVTVNGLVVNAGEFEGETELIPYFRSEVLRGTAAFLIIANGFSDYERAMRLKLLRELSAQLMGTLPTVEVPHG